MVVIGFLKSITAILIYGPIIDKIRQGQKIK
jgi:hypothetical protein